MMSRKKKDVEQELENQMPEEETQAPEEEAQADAAPEEPVEAEPETEEVNPLEEELAKQKENYLRLAAEYDNYRKRSVREKEALAGDVRSSCISDILPILDNIERALGAENTSAEDMRKGVELIQTQAAQIFEKLGVTAFGEAGDAFDPNLHNCIGTNASEDIPSGDIALVIQKGYKLGDKVIRPAMVMIAE